MHLSNISYINTNEIQILSFYLVFIIVHVSDAVLHPSSGVLQTVVAATGVCHGCEVEQILCRNH